MSLGSECTHTILILRTAPRKQWYIFNFTYSLPEELLQLYSCLTIELVQ